MIYFLFWLNQLKKYAITNLYQAITFNSAMIMSVKPDKNRELFFEDLDKSEFDALTRKYVKRKSLVSRVARNCF